MSIEDEEPLFLKYLPYWGFSGSEKYAQQSVGTHPNVSRDNVLTVFAQLASLRMNAKRSMISLFDRTSQHVVAEATPDLALRGDRSDRLWLGVQQFPRESITMCYCAVKSFVEEGAPMFVCGDLTRDKRFKDHPSVTGRPHNRFYVSVPIVSPDDYIIGSMAVLDDKPREEVTPEQEQLLQEISATVMDHLLAQRAMREEYREEKMVRALGLFVKGKSDLNDWFNGNDAPDKKYGGQLAHVNKRLEDLQVSAGGRGSEQLRDGEQATTGDSDAAEKDESPVHKYKKDGESDAPEDGSEPEKKKRPKMSPTTSHLRESLAPPNARSVVNRAASMIYQALDVEGAMFIDASVYARRQTVASTAPKNKDQAEPNTLNDGNDCRSLVLGHFTSSTSKSGVDLDDSHYVSLSGDFVSHLIDQYPRGMIFHLEEDGSISLSYEGLADNMDYAQSGSRGALTSEPERENMEQEARDVLQLKKVLPDARCISIYPVWDFQRGRWFTVGLVWTNDPGRVLSEPKDLTYLAAFSNTVMAEVSRLDLEAADRAKSDFISSISHELRSPLHGLLGTVELLQELVESYAQRSLVETVYSCGRTLLDTLNHLLDYAKINTLTHSSVNRNGPSKPKGPVSGSLQEEDLSVLVQEVIEGLLAGTEYQRRGAENRSGEGSDEQAFQQGTSASRLMTIVDIEWKDSWNFNVYSGAWRRVVMNLFGNALKYTQNGYIQLLMKSDTILVDGVETPAVHLTFSDSGRGMSQDFLTNHLYSAFLQEDTTSPGLGVGLHLVHQMVKSLKGTITFNSEIGKGTAVDVFLPIEVPEASDSLSPPQGPFVPLKETLSGKSVSLFMRSSREGNLGFDTDVFDTILVSLGHMISEWFGLRVLTADETSSEKPDFVVVTEHEYRNHYREGTNVPIADSAAIQPSYPLVVLSARTSSWEAIEESIEGSVIFLTQPVSPKTLATAFKHCLGPGQRSRNSSQSSLRSQSQQVHSEPLSPTSIPADKPNGKKNDALDPVAANVSKKGKAGESKAAKKEPENNKEATKRILLVDDNQVNLKIIEMCVKAAGFPYDSAKNGLEALEKFKENRYEMVVMDISMPVMDGLTATREIRQVEKKSSHNLSPTIIVILTAAMSGSMQHEATMSGVDMFLTKPTPLKRLRAILKDLAEGKQPTQEPR
ncbi:hybrid sensor histidine kinase/response regulator [Aspergillus stella-maris]|uniref:hybrid sensor histidine kinase/response regulator n=1 Tax=Aspergillus stella-maris TaxID=1810926 RepID=UPI003CCD3AD2